MKNCPKCNAENQPGAKFCGVCGAVFAKAQPRLDLPRFTKVHKTIIGVALAGGLACFFIFQSGGGIPKNASTLPVDQLDQKGIDAFNAKNYKTALKWFQIAADKGDFTAQNWIGWFYQNGLGVQTDNAQAVTWYAQAAGKGYAPSQTNLGWCYQNGLGVKTDVPEAISWYQKAVAQGNDSAEINMGYLYEKAIGVTQDSVEAKKWYKMAADHGSQEAKKDLDTLEAKQVNLNGVLHHPLTDGQ